MAASQDVLLTNVTGNTLCNEIAVLFKIPYLGIPKKGDPYNTTEINGHLLRAHLGHCCHASSKNGAEARWMVFILDTGSPKTYLSGDVSTEPYSHEMHHSIDLILGIWFSQIIRVPREIPVRSPAYHALTPRQQIRRHQHTGR